MVRELGEHYYRSTSFNFEDNLDLLSKFRVTDQWKLGFLPVSFVSQVAVSVKCDTLDEHGMHTCYVCTRGCCSLEDDHIQNQSAGWNAGPWGNFPDDPVVHFAKHGTSVQVELETLFGFKAGTEINITLWMSCSKGRNPLAKQEYIHEKFVPLLLPTLHRLADAGYRARVILIGGSTTSKTASGPRFVSEYNPVCIEEIDKDFTEVSLS